MSKSKKAAQDKKKEVTPFDKHKDKLISAVVIVFLTLIVFSPAFQNSFLSWDDDQVVVENPLVKNLSFQSIGEIFKSTNIGSYNPLTILSFAIENGLAGLSAKSFHTTNVILHIINSLLVFLLVYLLSRNNAASLVAALLFAVHPMHAEAVAWVTARKELLYSTFYLGSLILYIRYTDTKKVLMYSLSILLFLLSVLSKPVAVTLPAVLILVDYWSAKKFDAKQLMNKIPYAVISLVFIFVTFSTFGKDGSIALKYSALNSVFVFFYSVAFYLVKLVVPFGLSPIYQIPSTAASLPVLYMLAPVLVLGLAVLVYLYRSKLDGLVFGVLFFFITLLPVSNIIPVQNNSLVFDRFTYLPYIGLFIVISLLLFKGRGQGKSALKEMNASYAMVIAAVILVFSYLSFQRAGVWKDNVTLWTDAVEKNPDNAMALSFLGEAHYLAGDHSKALSDYSAAVKLDSTNVDYLNDRGNAYRELKEFEKSSADYKKALQLKPDNPKVLNNYGILYSYEKNYDEAMTKFNEVIKLDPKYTKAYINSGHIYFNRQQFDTAIIFYTKALELEPSTANVYYSRGLAFMKRNEYQKSVDDMFKAISFDANFEKAYQNLVYSYYLMKNYDKAFEYISVMRSKGFGIDPKFLQTLQKESGRNY